MGGVMQNPKENSEKSNSIGGWSALAIILAILAAFGTVDFAHLFLPEEWMKQWIKHEERVLEWMRFGAYMVGVGFVGWKFQNIKAWCNALFAKMHSEENSPVPDMILAGLVIIGVIGFAPLLFPDKWIGSDASVLKRLQFAAYLVGGAFLIWQLKISNRRATALEKTATLGEKGNITERFKNAIEHLGEGSESVRMGGIYGLYHVAVEAKKEYADTVKKILCAHAKLVMAKPGYTEKEKPSNEITAILDVLFPIDFSGGKRHADVLFEEVDISDWHLQGANVSYRNMKEMHGGNVNLSGAIMHRANLRNATLSGADLSGAILSDAILSGAIFWQAILLGAEVTVEQLLQARTLHEAQLDDHIREEIMRCKPELFDPPDEEE